jgi:hypothetical protein
MSIRHTRLLCAMSATLLSALLAASQALAPMELPPALRPHVKGQRFGIVTSIRGLPLGVRDGLQTLFGTQTLDIADLEPSVRSPTLSVGGGRGGGSENGPYVASPR